MSNIKERFEQYQYVRNSQVAKRASQCEVICKLNDEDCTEVLHAMTFVYDLAYRKAVNDCLLLSEVKFPTSDKN